MERKSGERVCGTHSRQQNFQGPRLRRRCQIYSWVRLISALYHPSVNSQVSWLLSPKFSECYWVELGVTNVQRIRGFWKCFLCSELPGRAALAVCLTAALRAEGIPFGSSGVHAVHAEARCLSMPLSSGICDDACPWGHVRGFLGQLQMDSWMRLGLLCPWSVWEGLGWSQNERTECSPESLVSRYRPRRRGRRALEDPENGWAHLRLGGPGLGEPPRLGLCPQRVGPLR